MTNVVRNSRGDGSIRRLSDRSWECVIQSKYINPESDSGKPKRIKRRGKTEKEAVKNCKQALMAWEKMFETQSIQKVDNPKTFGVYMEEFIENEVKLGITASSYKSYIYTMNANFYNYKISKLQLSMIRDIYKRRYCKVL